MQRLRPPTETRLNHLRGRIDASRSEDIGVLVVPEPQSVEDRIREAEVWIQFKKDPRGDEIS